MKIGVWLGSDIVDTEGGAASYQNRLIRLIDNYTFSEGVEVCFLSFFPQRNLSKEVIRISQIPYFIYRLIARGSFLFRAINKIDRSIMSVRGLKNVLAHTDVKVVYYISQTFCQDVNFPFIATNWDIGYKSTQAFPEIINKYYEGRDYFYMSVLPRSLKIVCESETGKKELLKYINVGEHKIGVMPMFAGIVSSIQPSQEQMRAALQELGLFPYRYFYYPAQFWAHKNHIGLLQAFEKFKKNDSEGYKLVLSGSDKGNLSYVREKVREMGIDQDVLFLGFISTEMVSTLYLNATCLVMASHFGPTNMPPIEAMELGCPVACSDLGGHREILGDSAVYFNSYDSESIYIALNEIVSNRQVYVEKIRLQKEKTKFNAAFAMSSLNEILKEVVGIRQNWA